VDGETIEAFAVSLDRRLTELRGDLREGMYAPSPLLGVCVPKPDGGLRRLAVPTVRDRVAQEAARIVIDPLLDRTFETCSFGYRRGRSVQQAVLRVQALRDEGYVWVVDADVDSFFDEVDHEILLEAFGRHVSDPQVRSLVERWVAAPVLFGSLRMEPHRGLPQGGPLSPVLANLYLDWFDEQVSRRGFKLVRFADDFLILCTTRPAARRALRLADTLLGELCLALDREKTRLTSFEQGFRYLGTLFVRSLAVASPRRKSRLEVEAARDRGSRSRRRRWR
jgi:group II intron reverse transcriptase/maturase